MRISKKMVNEQYHKDFVGMLRAEFRELRGIQLLQLWHAKMTSPTQQQLSTAHIIYSIITVIIIMTKVND